MTGFERTADKWDRRFIEEALGWARMSKDPRTKVGAVIVSPDGVVRSTGYNGFPRGIEDTPERLNNRDLKLKLTVHAEVNAILNAARSGISTLGCTLYLAATDDTGAVWGGPPCSRCCLDVIQAGIASVRSMPFKDGQSVWAADVVWGARLLKEAGVLYTELVGGALPSAW